MKFFKFVGGWDWIFGIREKNGVFNLKIGFIEIVGGLVYRFKVYILKRNFGF